MRINPSVLDRLIDHDPEGRYEPPASRLGSQRQLKQAVRRDLEWLLNTRRVASGIPPGLKEVSQSVAAYGLPDFSTVNVRSPLAQNEIRRAIEEAIRASEPRLEGVTVTLLPTPENERALHFRVDARLKIRPQPEPVAFDTMLQLSNGQCVVQEA